MKLVNFVLILRLLIIFSFIALGFCKYWVKIVNEYSHIRKIKHYLFSWFLEVLFSLTFERLLLTGCCSMDNLEWEMNEYLDHEGGSFDSLCYAIFIYIIYGCWVICSSLISRSVTSHFYARDHRFNFVKPFFLGYKKALICPNSVNNYCVFVFDLSLCFLFILFAYLFSFELIELNFNWDLFFEYLITISLLIFKIGGAMGPLVQWSSANWAAMRIFFGFMLF
jgi:hypothetical protein